jgi:hypothetical protein
MSDLAARAEGKDPHTTALLDEAPTRDGPAAEAWPSPGAEQHSPNLVALMVGLVGADQQVLLIGDVDDALAQALREQGCQLVVAALSGGAAEPVADGWERVIPGAVESLDLPCEQSGARFDAALLPDTLRRLRAPVEFLRGLQELLRPGGQIVAVVPNVAHASVRLALLGGRFPYGELAPLQPDSLRFYTRATAVECFEAAGLSVQRLVADEQPFRPPAEVAASPSLATLAQDSEARALHYVLAGLAVAPAGAADDRASELSRANELQRAELARLRQTLREQTMHLDTVVTQNQELRQLLLDAHEQLFRRDLEIEASRSRSSGGGGGARSGGVGELRGELRAELEQVRQELAAVRASRAWQLAHWIRSRLAARRAPR